ncbi:hypothetical protein F9Y90_03065 [Borrelia miyamotoi]|uniref:Uncharacterized protein n=1 Tax=Borrelia miyamotoi TaxID=47466 RepID=A0AAX3JMS2_9SPIR|nr:hypothetical protein [Borrelia miyamotoi]QFP42078.1 hypothetical protein F9Y90_03065 [Borrelia miyamotoi]WAZ71994.1 hypothetical protein O5404_03110 [Borrelia miyamotoi]WVI04708.1 hypothetical protein F9Y91_06830 [Borrelia miyamotoi]
MNIKTVLRNLSEKVMLSNLTIKKFLKKVITQLIKEGNKKFITMSKNINKIKELIKCFILYETNHMRKKNNDDNWQSFISHNFPSLPFIFQCLLS